jgi:ISXO2-like transposase domain
MVEGYYSIFKRGMKGVYQHCSEKHLHRYLAEFDFCYKRTTRALKGIGRQAADLSKSSCHRCLARELTRLAAATSEEYKM